MLVKFMEVFIMKNSKRAAAFISAAVITAVCTCGNILGAVALKKPADMAEQEKKVSVSETLPDEQSEVSVSESAQSEETSESDKSSSIEIVTSDADAVNEQQESVTESDIPEDEGTNEAAAADFDAMAEEMAILINEERAAEGLEPLYFTPYICEIADMRAKECAVQFSHKRPDGSSLVDAVDIKKMPYSKIAENIAGGKTTPEETMEQFRGSSKHWQSIMNPGFTHVGIGVTYIEGSMYGWYWTQVFVNPCVDLEGQRIVQRVPEEDENLSESVGVNFGDVNEDGIIDSYDFDVLLGHVSGRIILSHLQKMAADVLNDGIIDYSDVLVLAMYLNGTYDKLPI